MFLHTKWDTKFYTHTKQPKYVHFLEKKWGILSKRIKHAKTVIWSIYSWTPEIIPPSPLPIRTWKFWLLRIQFPPKLRFKTILIGWKPTLVNWALHRIVENDCWLTLKWFSWNFIFEYFSKIWNLKKMSCITDI